MSSALVCGLRATVHGLRCNQDRVTTEGAPSNDASSNLLSFAYRRRGRVVLAWIAAAIVIIGVGTSLAGEYEADYNTPGSESKAASEITESRFKGYSGQEIVVWKDEAGARSERATQGVNAFFAEAERVDHVARHTAIRVSEDDDRGGHAPADGPAGRSQGGRREADRRRRGERWQWASDQAWRGSDLRRASQLSPEGLGFLGAAIVLLIAFGSVVAAGLPLAIRAHRPGDLIRGPDSPACQHHRRPDWTTAVSG